MLWIIGNKRLWRGIIVGLLLIALMGPWVFDIIHVSGEGPCSAPWIRLTGDFCGKPLSGAWILSQITGMVAGLVTGDRVLVEVLLLFIFPVALLLPITSASILLLRGDQGCLLALHIPALLLAMSLILLSGLLSYPRFSWVVWGVWLYVGAAAKTLILEGAFLVASRKTITNQ